MDINLFFKKHNIDDFSVGSLCNLEAPHGFHPKNILPECKRIIVFGRLIPQFVFNLDSKVKSYYLYNLIADMDKVSFDLCNIFNMEGFSSVPVPTFFPARIREGKIKGIISLKHCAEAVGMGSFGENTLLISKKFGNRLCLSALLTAKEIDCTNKKSSKNLCLKCNKCIEICPTHAIKNKRVEVTRCINFTYSIPKILKPAVIFMMKLQWTEKYIENIVNIMGWNSDMVCSECLKICPHFRKI